MYVGAGNKRPNTIIIPANASLAKIRQWPTKQQLNVVHVLSLHSQT